MTERYSRIEIEEAATHINLDGYEETAAIIRQLLADRDKLITVVRRLRSDERFFGGVDEINKIMDDVLNEVDE